MHQRLSISALPWLGCLPFSTMSGSLTLNGQKIFFGDIAELLHDLADMVQEKDLYPILERFEFLLHKGHEVTEALLDQVYRVTLGMASKKDDIGDNDILMIFMQKCMNWGGFTTWFHYSGNVISFLHKPYKFNEHLFYHILFLTMERDMDNPLVNQYVRCEGAFLLHKGALLYESQGDFHVYSLAKKEHVMHFEKPFLSYIQEYTLNGDLKSEYLLYEKIDIFANGWCREGYKHWCNQAI